jgi:nickel superoxide dismutase
MKRQMLAGLGMMMVLGFVLTLSHERRADAHCQVPCGIYDDAARISQMLEDAETIKKAMAKINEMAGQNEALSINQVTRWVTVKEDHASRIITTVSEYFLTQKIKDVAPDADGYKEYLQQLADHHKVMRAAMTAKQTVDPANAEKLHQAIDTIARYWTKSSGS